MTRPVLSTLAACLLAASCSNSGVEAPDVASVELNAQALAAAPAAPAAAAAVQAVTSESVQTNPSAGIDAQSAQTQRQYYKARAAAAREALKTQREALQALKTQKNDPALSGKPKDEQQGLDDQIVELEDRIKQREQRASEFDKKAL